MKDLREEMLGGEFYHNGDKVEVTHLDEDESLVIVTEDYTLFYPVKVNDLVKFNKVSKPFDLDCLNEGDNLTFVANKTTYLLTWDDKKTNKTMMTKDKVYKGKVIKDEFGYSVIRFSNDQNIAHEITFDYAVGKIDVLEEI